MDSRIDFNQILIVLRKRVQIIALPKNGKFAFVLNFILPTLAVLEAVAHLLQVDAAATIFNRIARIFFVEVAFLLCPIRKVQYQC